MADRAWIREHPIMRADYPFFKAFRCGQLPAHHKAVQVALKDDGRALLTASGMDERFVRPPSTAYPLRRKPSQRDSIFERPVRVQAGAREYQFGH